MGRIITNERKEQIADARLARPDALGPALAELIIDGNVPVEVIATLLNVSEPTIYRWMYGNSEPRDADKILKVKRLMTILRKAKRGKDTPLEGNTRERIDLFMQVVDKYAKAPA